MWSGRTEIGGWGHGGIVIAAKDEFICSEVTELHTQCEIPWMKMEIAGCKPLHICEYRNDPKFSDRQVWANSADPDQTEEQSN